MKIDYYSAYGNTFAIIDNDIHRLESDKVPTLAINELVHPALDNLLFIETHEDKKLSKEISYFHSTHNETKNSRKGTFIFRMFEPDGSEALCCGNGLLCLSDYLYRNRGFNSNQFLTEIPTGNPVVRHTTYDQNKSNISHTVQIGSSQVISKELFCSNNEPRTINEILFDLSVHFENPKFKQLTGYLTYTGEPHLIFLISANLTHNIFRKNSALNEIFESSNSDSFSGFSNLINKHFSYMFPQAINISIAKINQIGLPLNYRCYERGIFKETMACGTAAVAIAETVFHILNQPARDILLWPAARNNYKQYADASVKVSYKDNHWHLTGYSDYIHPIKIRNNGRSSIDDLYLRQKSLYTNH